MSKKKLMLSMVLISSILLILYMVCLGEYDTKVFLRIHVNASGEADIRLIEQRSGWGEKATLREDAYTILDVGLQEVDSEQNPGYYLFLPGYLDLSQVYAVTTADREINEVSLDGRRLEVGGTHPVDTFKEGAHAITIGEQTIDFEIVKGSAISSVWICTEMGMDYVHGNIENITSGSIRVLSEGGQTEYSGELEALKGRGNSSWYMRKKSYGIKLTNQASLLGMTPGKSWVLQGGALDKTALRNKIFLDMAKECGLENAVDSRLVDLYIDGAYYGCYVLAEKIAVATGRLEIGDLEEKTLLVNEETPEVYGRYRLEDDTKQMGYLLPNNPKDLSGGYLLEIETYMERYNAEQSGFVTQKGLPVVVKAPSYATMAQVQYISAYVQEFEDALYSPDGYNSLGKSYLDYIDAESFAVRYLVDEVSKNIDAGYSSYFFYKPQGSDKMYAGPVWDYDTSLGNNNGWGDTQELTNPSNLYVNRALWSEQLWQKQEFQEVSKELFEKRFLPYLEELAEYKLDEYVDVVYDSVKMEAICHGRELPDKDFEQLKSFLVERKEYLQEELVP